MSCWLLLHFYVRTFSGEGVAEDPEQEKWRAKWRKQKAEQRRRKAKPLLPASPGKVFVRLVFAERDYRLEREHLTWRHPDLTTHAYRAALLYFSADVWVARTVLEKQFGKGKVKPKQIRAWLIERGLTHGCKHTSLRTMIWRAENKLKRIEGERYRYDPSELLWPPFDVADAVERAKGRFA